MANTVDTLGEQTTLDMLVAHSLEEFEDNRIRNVRENAFINNYTIESISLPNATDVGKNAFKNCYRLKSINIPQVETLQNATFEGCYSLNEADLSNVTSINSNNFSRSGLGSIVLPNCTQTNWSPFYQNYRTSTIDISQKISTPNIFGSVYSLVHLVLRSNTLMTTRWDPAPYSALANGMGWIYVPADLVDSYKSASNWSTYADIIVSLNEYPKALTGETITDTWEEIFQAEDDGTYSTKYSVGDTKFLNFGGTYCLMQIVAFNKDILSADGESKAKITWISKGLPIDFPMNPTDGTISWSNCECRMFLNNTIYNQIGEIVRNRILSVNKTYTNNYTTETVADKLWIPSYREIFGGDSYERSGVNYTDFFTDSTSRIKPAGLSSGNTDWWLRSFRASSFCTVRYTGENSFRNPSEVKGVTLCFCT